jgi:hypothetical protein
MKLRLDSLETADRLFASRLLEREGEDGLWRRVADACSDGSDYFWCWHELRLSLWHEWHDGLRTRSGDPPPNVGRIAHALLHQWEQRGRKTPVTATDR